MNIFEAFLLGIVQGLTEFLPVSSSGHLVLGQALLGIEQPGVTFEVVVHLATLCAVLWVYRRRVGELLVGMAGGQSASWGYAGLIVLASIPAGLAGVFARPLFEDAFGRPVLAAAMLLATGAIVYTLRFTLAAAPDGDVDARRGVWVGTIQAAAILPGISRSGSTVALGVWLGVSPVRMAEFSFLLSVPAIAGAGLLQLGQVGEAAALPAPPLVAGFLAAAVSGVLAIRLFVRMLRAGSFHHFAWYCWVVGSAYLLAALLVPALR
ncbi:MAG: undecaprenyl-diphosphate phosphatase [Gemmatimonadota bacterium]